jgi:hypothetical protein
MTLLPPVEKEIRRICDERAKEPLITGSGLEEALEKRFDSGFSRRYIAKLTEKVARRALVDIDRMKIEPCLDFTRNNYRMMREELLTIVYWHPEENDMRVSQRRSAASASRPPRTSS